MVLPWFCHDFTMVLPWFYHGFTMIFPWCYHDFPMVLPWFSHGFTVNFPWFYHDFTMVLPWFCHGKAMVISRTPLILSVASSMCHPQWRCSRMVSLIWVWKNGGYDEIWWVHTCYSLSLNVMSYWWCLYFCMLHLQNYNLKWKKDDEVWNLEAAYIHSKPFECFLNWLSSKALVSV